MKTLITAAALTATAATTASAFDVTISLGGSTTYGHQEITLQQVHEQGLVQTWEQRNKYLSWWKWRKAQAIGLLEDKKQLTADLAAANSNISSLNASVASLEADKAVLENEMASLEADVAYYTSLYNTTLEAYNEKSAKLVSVEADLDDAINKLAAKQSQLVSVTSALNSAYDKIDDLEDDVNDLEAEVDELDEEVASLNQTIGGLNAQIDIYDEAGAIDYANLDAMTIYNDIDDGGLTFADDWGKINKEDGGGEYNYRQSTYHVNGESGGDGETDIQVTFKKLTIGDWTRVFEFHFLDGAVKVPCCTQSIYMNVSELDDLERLVERSLTASYNEGYKDGFEAGYKTGYKDGASDAKKEAGLEP